MDAPNPGSSTEENVLRSFSQFFVMKNYLQKFFSYSLFSILGNHFARERNTDDSVELSWILSPIYGIKLIKLRNFSHICFWPKKIFLDQFQKVACKHVLPNGIDSIKRKSIFHK